MGPYNSGPISALFLRVALIKAGVRGAGVTRAVLKREYHLFEKLSFFRNLVYCILSIYPFLLTNFLTNIPIKSGNKDLFIFRIIWNRRYRVHKVNCVNCVRYHLLICWHLYNYTHPLNSPENFFTEFETKDFRAIIFRRFVVMGYTLFIL